MEDRLFKLRQLLTRDLPGITAQYKMAPFTRERIIINEAIRIQYKPSAVMLLICEDEHNNLFLPLIKRSSYKGAHSAQVSFSGGKFEPDDVNLMKTAMRECSEEIGVNQLEVIGKLTPLAIPVSGFLVEPFVGWCTIKNPDLQMQEREVQSIIKLPLLDLLNEDIIKSGEIKIENNLQINTNWFSVSEHQVWGATAMILSELKEIIKDAF